MKSYYKATTGDYDGLVIYSFPKNHDVHTFEQIVKSSGLIEKVYTTKLMTSEDGDVALRAAKELVDKYGGWDWVVSWKLHWRKMRHTRDSYTVRA